MFATVVTLLALTSAAFWLLSRYLLTPLDPREPPLAPGALPIIGHIWRMYREKHEFFQNANKQVGAPIFTVQLPFQKLYIVSNLELVQKVERIKTLSYQHLSAKATTTMHWQSMSNEAKDLILRDPSDEDGILHASSHAFVVGAQPGENLDALNRVTIRELCLWLDDPSKSHHQGPVQLHAWLRKLFTTVSTNGVYGKLNPYRDEKVGDAFWAFDKNAIQLLLLPHWLTPSVRKARDQLASAFLTYFRQNGHEHASPLMQMRYAVERKHGLSHEDMALIECNASIAILANTIPTAFWLLLMIYSDHNLLSQIRAEVDAITTTTTTTNPSTIKPTHNINTPTLQTHCPLLLSTLHETLRSRGIGPSVRLVLHDTLLPTTTTTHLLKKNSIVQIPAHIFHTDPALYPSNSDPNSFNAFRFLPSKQTNIPNPLRAFRPFGSGTSKCPGRHLALSSTLSFAALFVSRYDMSPTGNKSWFVPSAWNTEAINAILVPDTDIEVEIVERRGFEGGSWVLQ